MTAFVNFRNCEPTTRHKMRLRNSRAVQDLENAEIRASGGLWIRKSDFPGCLDHMAAEKPNGHGQMFRF